MCQAVAEGAAGLCSFHRPRGGSWVAGRAELLGAHGELRARALVLLAQAFLNEGQTWLADYTSGFASEQHGALKDRNG